MHVEPFAIAIDESVLTDLRTRIGRTRWPSAAPGAPWEQGTDLEYLRDVLAYWANDFDWRERERELNDFAHFRAEVDGVRIHFVHERARNGAGTPLVLTHGWPSTFAELLPLVPLLTDPEGYDIAGPAFDVVIPSLTGSPTRRLGWRPGSSRSGVRGRTAAAIPSGASRATSCSPS